ncbi:hypothetical protein CPB83DRAFT_900701 [Crepidotus variabilis]|uniref:Uncharacterized protein n=1 Tax=Crepidotus variabilis TaxID=179855 RepID=A0A9P6BBH9_9AGAR|nr:hypothetical protein CPB83DRAFT_900701 [Crepidotus variabilis]
MSQTAKQFGLSTINKHSNATRLHVILVRASKSPSRQIPRDLFKSNRLPYGHYATSTTPGPSSSTLSSCLCSMEEATLSLPVDQFACLRSHLLATPLPSDLVFLPSVLDKLLSEHGYQVTAGINTDLLNHDLNPAYSSLQSLNKPLPSLSRNTTPGFDNTSQTAAPSSPGSIDDSVIDDLLPFPTKPHATGNDNNEICECNLCEEVFRSLEEADLRGHNLSNFDFSFLLSEKYCKGDLRMKSYERPEV